MRLPTDDEQASYSPHEEWAAIPAGWKDGKAVVGVYCNGTKIRFGHIDPTDDTTIDRLIWLCDKKLEGGLSAERQLDLHAKIADAVEQTAKSGVENLPHPTEQLEYRRITSAELDSGDFAQEYLIPGVLVAGQPCIIAGPQKALKTSTIIDLAVSLDRCGKFLGYFPATRAARVGIMSGESGLATIQETARRICAAAKCKLSDTAIIWSDNLPKFGQIEHGEAVERFIRNDELEVLVIDPAYLAIPSGNEGSVFAQGDLLRGMTEVCQKNGAALVLAHHTKKGRADAYAPPTLEEIAWAGFGEFARQWILIGRREAYQIGSGDHRLWLSTGGSAGHGGLYGVDVLEGTQSDGRRWEVAVSSVTNLERERQQQKDNAKAERDAKTLERNCHKLRQAMKKFPAGETARALKETSGLNGEKFGEAITTLLGEGRAESCQVNKRGGPYDGFKPTPHT